MELLLAPLKVKTFQRGLHLAKQFTIIRCILNSTRRSRRVESGLRHTDRAVNDTHTARDGFSSSQKLLWFTSPLGESATVRRNTAGRRIDSEMVL